MELRLRLSALATPNTCPMHTESYDAQYEDRECADIQQCVDHGSHQHALPLPD